jgi:hypothetical protein
VCVCGALVLQEKLQKDKAAQKREERLLMTAVYEVTTALYILSRQSSGMRGLVAVCPYDFV